jgi:hypothetical protein
MVSFLTNTLPGTWRNAGEFNHHSTTGHLPNFLWRCFHNQSTTAPYDLVVYRKTPDDPK